MDKLIICETDSGRYAVRPMSWAGIWNEKGQIQESLNHLAVFIEKEDAEKFVEWKEAEEQLEECHANINVKLIVKYFIETIFKGEHHEGFCVLTNEDAKKFEEYKKFTKQGKLLKLPCAVGDMVYEINKIREMVSTFTVNGFSVSEHGIFVKWELSDGIYRNFDGFNDEEIGKTVFFTREEAEAALKELQKG